MANGNRDAAYSDDKALIATQGAFQGFTVASLMQLIERDSLNCSVQVSGGGVRQGAMVFKGGEPLDATCGGLAGDEAIVALVSSGSVSVEFLKMPEQLPAKTVASSTTALILEGARVMDERQAFTVESSKKQRVNPEKQIELQKMETGMAGLKQMMKDIADEMDGVIAVGVVGMDGITVAVHNPTGADMDVVSAKFAMVMKLVERSVEDMNNLGDFEENLVQTANAWILTRFLDKQYYLACIVSREGTLGNVRLVAKKYLEQVRRAL